MKETHSTHIYGYIGTGLEYQNQPHFSETSFRILFYVLICDYIQCSISENVIKNDHKQGRRFYVNGYNT